MLSVDVEESVGQRLEAAEIFTTAFHITVWQTIGAVRSQLVVVVWAVTPARCAFGNFFESSERLWSATNCVFVEKITFSLSSQLTSKQI